MKAVPLLLLCIVVPGAFYSGGVFNTAQATTSSGLGIWNPSSGSPVVLNNTATVNSLVTFNLNVTGGASIDGFDVNVTWDPTILTYVSSTTNGGVFDLASCTFQHLINSHAVGFVEQGGVLLGCYTSVSGVLFTFTLKVVAASPSSTSIHISKGSLNRPTTFFPVLMDGFFSNQPGADDLMLTSMTVSEETATVGDIVNITVGVRNNGITPMSSVVVTVKGNTTIPVNSTAVGTMTANSFQTVTIVWNTTTYAPGVYNLNATISTTSPDAFQGDNSLALEQVTLGKHDLAITSLSGPSSILVNQTAVFHFVLENLGTFQDTANVTIMASNTPVASGSFTLAPGSTSPEILAWNTTGVTPNVYQLKAVVKPVPGESSTANNIDTDGTITVKLYYDHDLAITGSLPGSAIAGQETRFSFVVKDLGLNDETYTVRVFLNNTVIEQSQGAITSRTNKTVSFTWNTRTYTPGKYILSANVTSASTDEDPSNNQVAPGQFTLVANQPPVALFTASSTSTLTGTQIQFNATASYDTDSIEYPLSFSWSFGDGTQNQTGSIVSHAFANPGTYTVTLTVTDAFGFSSTIAKTVQVNPQASFPQLAIYAIIGVAVVGALLAGWFLLVRRRNRHRAVQGPTKTN